MNEIKYEYDADGLLSKEFQNPNGQVVSTTPYVAYTYDTAKSFRPTSQIYPDGNVVSYTYASGHDDQLNRVTQIKNGSTVVAEYVYIGANAPAITKYPQPGLSLD